MNLIHTSKLRPLALAALLTSTLLPHVAMADDEEKLPPPAAGASLIDGGVEAVLPGRLFRRQTLDDGTLALVVLLDKEARQDARETARQAAGETEPQGVEPDLSQGKRQFQLLRLDPGSAILDTLLTFRADSVALGQAPAPDGAQRLVMAANNYLLAFESGSPGPTLLLEAPGLDLGAALRGGFLDSATGALLVPRVARLESWQPGDDGLYVRQGHTRVPVTVRRRSHGLELRTPKLNTVVGEDGSPRVVLGPVAEGDHRMWLRPVELDSDEPTATHTAGRDAAKEPTSADDITDDGNFWARFKGPEEVRQSWLLDVDGRTILAVSTKSADKIGVFEKLSLRTFSLRTDLTRGGAGPSLSALTATRNWYEVDLEIVDLDPDGRDDLAVIQPAGLGAGKLVLEVYRGKGTGGFFQTPRRTELDLDAGRILYGPDLDGDRQPDLLTTSGGQLLLYPGAKANHKKRVIEKKPRVLLGNTAFASTPATRAANDDERSRIEKPRGRPALVELDGRQHVLLRTTHRGRTVLRLVGIGG